MVAKILLALNIISVFRINAQFSDEPTGDPTSSADTEVVPAMKFTFFEKSGQIFDQINAIALNLGSEGSDEPLLLPNRGLYFGGGSFANITSTTLSNSHSIEVVFLAFRASSFQTLARRPMTETVDYLAVTLQETDPEHFAVNITYMTPALISTDPTDCLMTSFSSEIQYNTWNKLTWNLSFVPVVGSTLTVYVNGTQTDTITKECRFYDKKVGHLMLGMHDHTSFFNGYLFSFEVYENNLGTTVQDELKCPCDLCYYNNQCLSLCLPQQYNGDNGNCADCDPECTDGCYRAGDCRIHPDPLCFEFTDLIDNTCSQCLTHAKLTAYGCQCISGSVVNQELTECECGDGYWMVDGQCLECFRYIRSQDITTYFADNYMEVVFEFAVDINVSIRSCEGLFPPATLAKFGEDPSCNFKNHDTLIVSLGENFSLTKELIQFNSNVLVGLENECGFFPEDIWVEIDQRYNFPAPTVKYIYNRAVDLSCMDFYVDASPSSGRLKHTLIYQWKVKTTPDIPSITNNPAIKYDGVSFHIPVDYLKEADLEVTLQVMNYLGQFSSKSFEVQVRDSGLVSISFDDTIDYFFYAADYSQFSVDYVSSCSDQPNIEMNWNLQSVRGNLTKIDEKRLWSAQTSPGVLLIPENLFKPYSESVFEMKAIDGKGNQGSITISLLSIPKDLVIKADRSSGDSGLYQDLTIDASSSYDPNENKKLNFLWSCVQKDTDCSGIIVQPNSSSLLVYAEALALETYTFTLQVWIDFNQGKLSKTRSFTIRVVDAYVPKVLIALAKNKGQPDVVLSKDVIRLVAYLDEPGKFTYQWHIEKGDAYKLSSPSNRSTLTIKGDSLTQGWDYSVALYITKGETVFRFQYDFYVNMPPSLGDFKVFSKSVEFAEFSKMQATNWVDTEEDYPLTYAFGFTFLDKKFYLNIKNQKSIFRTELPYSSNLDFWVEVYDNHGDFTKTSFDIDIEKNPNLDLEELINKFEKEITNDKLTTFHTLPSAMNLLAVRVINEKSVDFMLRQRAFDIIMEGNRKLLELMPMFTEQDVTSILSILELCTNNAVLMSVQNANNVKVVIDSLLVRAADKLNHENMKRLLGIIDHIIYSNTLSIYQDPELVSISFEMLRSVQVKYAQLMNYDENYDETTDQLELSIYNAEVGEISEISISESGVSFELPNGFTGSDHFPSKSVTLGLTVIKGETDSESDSVPDIIDISLYDYSSLGLASLNFGDSYMTFNVPVFNISESLTLETAECVYLDEAIHMWNTAGCAAAEISSTEIICKCNHMSIFSAGAAITASNNVMQNSNLAELAKPEKIEDINEVNAIGLYFTGSILLVYVIMTLVHCIRTRKNPSMERQETISRVNKSPEKKPTEDASPVTAAQMENEDEDAPEKPKPFKQLVLEKHELLRMFLQYDPEFDRISRITMVFIVILGEVFLIGLFYQSSGDDENNILDISFVDTIKEYSWEDFWVMIISAFIMIIVIICFKAVFKQVQPKKIDDLAKVERCNKVKQYLGLALAWCMMALFSYGIVMFSVAFTKRKSFMWFFNSAITIIADNLILELIKILIIAYALYIYSSITYKKKKKRYEEDNQGSPSVSVSHEIGTP